MKKNGNYAVSAAAFGREGYLLKCVTAMELCLNSEPSLSPDEAVALTCTGIDLEAISDAVNRGLKVQKAATIIFSMVVFVGTILLTVVAMHAPGIGAGVGAGTAAAHAGSSVVQHLPPTKKELTLFSEFMKPTWAQSSAARTAMQSTTRSAVEKAVVSNVKYSAMSILILFCIHTLNSILDSSIFQMVYF